jgi:hypothetical protein
MQISIQNRTGNFIHYFSRLFGKYEMILPETLKECNWMRVEDSLIDPVRNSVKEVQVLSFKTSYKSFFLI